jgi:hypothetical protein
MPHKLFGRWFMRAMPKWMLVSFFWIVTFQILHAQEADDGSQPQRTMLSIGNGLQGGDFVSLSLIEAGENKVELQVESGESVSSLIDRLVI